MAKNLRIWLGGSFDPVHLGHLAIIRHIANVLENYAKFHPNEPFNTSLSLLPTARNPLKPNPTENSHRLKMLELGLQDLKKTNFQNSINFQIDTTEIYQTDTVFTFNTFSHFREIYSHDSLIFVLGMDSILGFEKWYKGFELPNLCHLWVMPRDGNSEKETLKETLPKAFESRLTKDLADLINTPNGRIYLDTHQVATISSSQIRAELANLQNLNWVKQWLNPSVFDYILQHKLY